jgi:hypothetical protein
MSKHRLAKIVTALFASFMLLFVSAPPASAGVNDFTFESMHVDYVLSLGEHNIPQLKVTETLVAVFPEADQNRGIQRQIPDSYRDHGLATEVLSVVDEKGAQRDFTTETQDGYIQLVSKNFDDRYVHGSQTYVITYTQKWVVGHFGATDEFYWDVNGTGWGQPFDSVSASVFVTPELSEILQVEGVSCYRGLQGSNQVCESKNVLTRDKYTVAEFEAKNLAPGETLSINLPFKPGVINTGNLAQVTGTLEYSLFWAFAAGILVVLIWAVFYRVQVIGGRRMRKFVAVQYEGPETPELGVVATVLGSKNWQSALLVQAGVFGYANIATDAEGNWSFSRTDKKVETPEQKRLLDGLFDGCDRVSLGKGIDQVESLRIVKLFAALSQESQKESLSLGFYSHLAVKPALLGWLVILGQSAGMIWAGASMDAVVDAGFAGLPILLGVVATAVHFAVLLTKRLPTQAGVDLRVYMEGLKEYIGLVEKDRLAFLQSPKGAARASGKLGQTEILKLYERALPWAILLGLEKEWAKVLSTYYDDTREPSWIPLAVISNLSLSQLNTAISQSLAVSSSSGSDGGGSAGGGGGGGGGGGV